MSASPLYYVADKQRPDEWSTLEEAEVCYWLLLHIEQHIGRRVILVLKIFTLGI